MFTYTLIVISLIVISSTILSYKFNKINISNLYIIVSTAISSAVIGIIFPYLFLALFDTTSAASSILSLIIICVTYIVLVVLFTYLISTFILRLDFKLVSGLAGNNSLIKFNSRIIEKLSLFSQREPVKNDEKIEAEVRGIETLPPENEIKTELCETDSVVSSTLAADEQAEPEAQKTEALPSEDKIDTGLCEIESIPSTDIIATDEEVEVEVEEIEALPPEEEKNDSRNEPCKDEEFEEQSGIDEFVDKAFKLKGKGDYEGAITHFMRALNQKPKEDIIFWIVLDVCTMYKALGQAELARNFLESYSLVYGNVINESVRAEVERNLI